jgi:TetR/AcrR family transcriptional regulator
MGIHERKEREKEKRREDILDAAQQVFFEKGLTLATMDDISAAAELSKATIYLYYVSKEDLYLAVAMRGIKLLHDKFEEIILNEPSVVMALHRIKGAYTEFFHTQRNYFRMLSFLQSPHMHKQVSDAMRQICTAQNDKNWEVITGLFARGIREKKIRGDISPADLAVMVWSNTTALMMRIDTENESWMKRRNIDLNNTLEFSFRMTVDAILTPEARLEYETILQRESFAHQHS